MLGAPPEAIVGALERLGTDLALVRASQVIGHAPESLPVAKAHAGRGLHSTDRAVRLLALHRLAMLEVQLGYRAGDRDARGAPAALPLLRSLLDEVGSVAAPTPLIAEVEARVHKSLGEGYSMIGRYELAESHLARALAMAEGLGMTSFADQARILLGLAVFHAGRIAEANHRLASVAADPRVEPVYALSVRQLLAMSALWLGDDDAALALLTELSAQPGRPDFVGYHRRFALVVTGRGGLDVEADEAGLFLPHELAVMFRSYQHLLRANERRRGREREATGHLEEARRSLDTFRATTPWLRSAAGFLRSLASLRLGEVGLAADQYRGVDEAQEEHVTVRALALGLALEIGLHYHGRDVRPIARTTHELAGLVSGLPAPARLGIAMRFRVFLPLAGAFLAHSPHSVTEFLNVCGPAVMNFRDRPISAYGQRGLRPVHGTRWTLEAFGYPPHREGRDGGGQLEAEEAVLLQRHGEREHWFTPVPPAQLAYQYLRVHELSVGASRAGEPSPWRSSALDVARSHGLLPSGSAGYCRRERQELLPALKLLLAGGLGVAGFRNLVNPGP